MRQVEDQEGLTAVEPLGHLGQLIVGEVQGVELVILKHLGRNIFMSKRIVSEIEGSQTRQILDLSTDGLYIILLHCEMFKMMQLADLLGNGSQLCVVQFKPSK